MGVKKKGLYTFLLSFIISLIVLAGLFTIYLLYSKSTITDIPKTDIPYLSDYKPQKNESMSVLLLGVKEPESPPDVCILYHYDAPNGIIYSIAIPTETLCESNGRVDTIKGHYEYEGIRGCVNAVKKLLNIELDRYVRVQSQGIANMVDFLGGIKYTIAADKKIGNEILYKGEQLLDGRRVTTLMFNLDENKRANAEFQGELTDILIESGFNEKIASKYKDFVGVVFYNGETNLSQYDFSSRQRGIVSRLTLNSIVSNSIKFEGEYRDNKFYTTDKCIKSISDIINASV